MNVRCSFSTNLTFFLIYEVVLEVFNKSYLQPLNYHQIQTELLTVVVDTELLWEGWEDVGNMTEKVWSRLDYVRKRLEVGLGNFRNRLGTGLKQDGSSKATKSVPQDDILYECITSQQI